MLEQMADFVAKYGERMGNRKLPSILLAARNDGQIIGLVGMEVTLLDATTTHDIVDAADAETTLRQAVAGLRPKQRRSFKDATVNEIVTKLLPNYQVVCCLSNLAVSPMARRRGIAAQLCHQVDDLACKWQFDRLYLKVEAENAAARDLYERRLGYQIVAEVNDATGIRLDLDSGSFVQVDVPLLLLSKPL